MSFSQVQRAWNEGTGQKKKILILSEVLKLNSRCVAVPNKVNFTDEAGFHINDMLIAKAADYGVLKFPIFSTNRHYTHSELFWCGVSCCRVIGPSFFSETLKFRVL